MRRLFALSSALLALSPSSPAAAQDRAARGADDRPYCEGVRARSAGEADLLMAPRLFVQGLRFPQNGQQIDVGPTAGAGYQFRAGVSFSPIDYYKGLRLLRTGEADCDQHALSTSLRQILERGSDGARLAALRAQGHFLTEHAADWRALVARAQARLAVHVITMAEYDAMAQTVDTLERKLVHVDGEAAGLAASGASLSHEALRTMVQDYVERTMRLERAMADVRSLDAWKLQLTGGVIPQSPPDWFGLAEVSFNLGALGRSGHEERYLDARADELRHAGYELESQLDRLGRQTEAALDEARRELSVVQHSIEVVASTRSLLERAGGEGGTHAQDALALEQISLDADRVFLRALIDALGELAAGARQ